MYTDEQKLWRDTARREILVSIKQLQDHPADYPESTQLEAHRQLALAMQEYLHAEERAEELTAKVETLIALANGGSL